MGKHVEQHNIMVVLTNGLPKLLILLEVVEVSLYYGNPLFQSRLPLLCSLIKLLQLKFQSMTTPHFPSDFSTNTYEEYLLQLEKVTAVLQSDGSVLVLGNFNAHLRSLGGTRGSGDINAHGQLFMDLTCRINLYTVALSYSVAGPTYTYFSGNHGTTVDCLLDSWGTHLVTSCQTIEHHPLKFSNHLPISLPRSKSYER